jgi:N-acetylneuraminic acid mutarotase
MKTQKTTIMVRGKSSSMSLVLVLAVLLSQARVSLAAGQTWTKRADMPTARYDFATSVVNGKIYAIGGGVSFYTKTGLKTVEEYDPQSDTWTRTRDMPTGRQAFSACAVNGRIYAVGGIVSPPGPGLSVVEEYDPATDIWTKKANMPTARAGVVTAVVDGKIYAMGGVANAPGPGLATVEEYDPVGDTWTRKTDMPTARHFPGIGVADGKIYVIGGIRHCDYTSSLSTVEEYDPATDVWTTRASMPTPRTALSAGVVNGKVYAIGGAQSYTSTATIFSAVEEYDPAADTWTVKADMPTARQSLSTSVVNGTIYAIGGSKVPFPWACTATVEAYEPITSVRGSGSTSGINDYQFAGTATLNIRGQEKSADLLVTLLEPPVVDANGVQHVKATHEFTFADGSTFITSDQEIATPTETPGLHILTGIMDIASGTGMYEGVTGQLRIVNGTIDFAAQPPAAQFEIAGAVYEDTTGTGATTATNASQFAGTATLTIHGQKKSADLLVTLLEPPVVDANGVQHVKATHEFTFADGSGFITSDQETVTPTTTPGLSTLIAIMDISSGTGMYEGVTGRLMANGTADSRGRVRSVQFEIAGAVCEDTTGSGATAAINDYQFAGTAILTIHGWEKSADLLVTLLEAPVVDADGVQHIKAMHQFTFADGSSFITSDQEVATPTETPGLHILTGIMDITSGTGMYEGVTGRLSVVNGTIDFAAQPPAAQFEILGAVISREQ